jgi:hypothetical protein
MMVCRSIARTALEPTDETSTLHTNPMLLPSAERVVVCSVPGTGVDLPPQAKHLAKHFGVDLPHGVIAHMDPLLVKKIDWETTNNLEDWDISLDVSQQRRAAYCGLGRYRVGKNSAGHDSHAHSHLAPLLTALRSAPLRAGHGRRVRQGAVGIGGAEPPPAAPGTLPACQGQGGGRTLRP